MVRFLASALALVPGLPGQDETPGGPISGSPRSSVAALDQACLHRLLVPAVYCIRLYLPGLFARHHGDGFVQRRAACLRRGLRLPWRFVMTDGTVTPIRRGQHAYTDTAALNDIHALLTSTDLGAGRAAADGGPVVVDGA